MGVACGSEQVSQQATMEMLEVPGDAQGRVCQSGFVITQYVCLKCRRKWPGAKPQPAIAA